MRRGTTTGGGSVKCLSGTPLGVRGSVVVVEDFELGYAHGLLLEDATLALE